MPNPLLPETRSEVAVPIAVGQNVLGVLDVQQNIKNGLSKQDSDLLQAIANQVSVAVQNSRQFAAAQTQADRETLINTINQRIQAATDIKSVLQIAARELASALEARKAAIQITNPDHSMNME